MGGFLGEAMNNDEFNKKLTQTTNPVIVEFWAPWCAPCRAMKPLLEKAEKEYSGKVELWRINADESPELLNSLKIFGIPTLIAFKLTNELFRKTGSQNIVNLLAIFEATYRGEKPVKMGLSTFDRLIRMSAGTILLLVGIAKSIQWLPLAAGLILLFSVVYDRCPIYAAITQWIKSKTNA